MRRKKLEREENKMIKSKKRGKRNAEKKEIK